MYGGIYCGSRKHEPDLDRVLARSWDAGLDKIIVTGGSLEESRKAVELAGGDGEWYGAAVSCARIQRAV